MAGNEVRKERRRPPAWLLERLNKGNQFHQLVAKFYQHTGEGVVAEKAVTKARVASTNEGPKGRADIILWVLYSGAESDDQYEAEGKLGSPRPISGVVVIETKWTDWDVLHERGTVAPNLARHRRQVWRYREGWWIPRKDEKDGPKVKVDLDEVDRQAAMVYPWKPETPGLADDIEIGMGMEGISVVWFDEPPPEDSPAYASWEALRRGEFGGTAVLRRPSRE